MFALLLKASLIVAVLLAFYKIFLERESFFSANRIFLVGSIVLTFLLPFISLPEFINDQGFVSSIIDKTDMHESLRSPEKPSITENGEIAVGISDETTKKQKVGVLDWILRLYYFGVAIFSFNLFLQVAILLVKAKNSADKIQDTDGVIISKYSGPSPCSFFNYIFINPDDYDYETYEQILEHEKIHVKKLHAFDLLLAEIAIIFLWFNPAIWILKNEIEKNIEYETDALMLQGKTVGKERYQMNLLAIATDKKPLVITTNYNQSMIKQRILRMNAKKSNPHSYWKYAFMVPLVFAMLLAINKPVAAITENVEPGASRSAVKDETGDASNCRELLSAIKEEDVEKVEQMLKTVDPDCSYRGDGEPRSPLVAAARKGNLVIGKMLIDANADVDFHAAGDETPLMAAAARGHLDFVKYLVSKNADVNKTLAGDGSALLVASRGGRLDVVKFLISIGADVNAQITGDGTALICAVRNNHYEVSKLLLENGADPYQNSPGDEYAMFHARSSNNKTMIDLLKKYDKEN
jgi:beta-lactamase regulating signal transducer with metallopeptidase domain